MLALERRRLNHWSRKPERVAALAEALVFARYFRRFGQRLWMREGGVNAKQWPMRPPRYPRPAALRRSHHTTNRRRRRLTDANS